MLKSWLRETIGEIGPIWWLSELAADLFARGV
jgi:hypothetical protein